MAFLYVPVLDTSPIMFALFPPSVRYQCTGSEPLLILKGGVEVEIKVLVFRFPLFPVMSEYPAAIRWPLDVLIHMIDHDIFAKPD